MEDTSTETAKNYEDKQMVDVAEKKNSPSKRQLDHLAYARSMKKLKKQEREHQENVQNNYLDFIHKRLTNIEKNLNEIAEQQTTNVNPRYVSVKRKKAQTEEDSSDLEKSRKSRKFKTETEKKTENPSLMENILPYIGKAAFVGTSAIILSLLKNYATSATRTRDGDTIGGYYIGPDV